MRVLINPHTLDKTEERGANEEEIYEVIDSVLTTCWHEATQIFRIKRTRNT